MFVVVWGVGRHEKEEEGTSASREWAVVKKAGANALDHDKKLCRRWLVAGQVGKGRFVVCCLCGCECVSGGVR